MVISSAQNATFKWLKSLLKRKYRQREGAVIIEGRRLIAQVKALGYALDYLILEETVDWPEEAAQTLYLTHNLFNQLSDTVHSQGVLAVVSILQNATEPRYDDDIVVLNGIQDPGNMGTILRSCESFGYRNVVATKGCVDVYSRKVLRASMGALFNLNVVQNYSSEDLVAALKRRGVAIYTTALSDGTALSDLSAKRPFAIVFGNEGNGVEAVWLENAEHCVAIEMVGQTESLNVAASAAIVLYQLRKY